MFMRTSNKMPELTKYLLISIVAWLQVPSLGFSQDFPSVRCVRVPGNGLQPQVATGENGMVHLVYFLGDPAAGDVIYRFQQPSDGGGWSEPIRVNSQIGSSVALGTIRGPHLALGKSDQVHVAWNGSNAAKPKGIGNPAIPEDSPHHFSAPMLYTHMEKDGDGFEEQRNLMTHTYALDGGGSVAANKSGNVYVVWHANSTQSAGSKEADRAVWVAKSDDSGGTFSKEVRINSQDTGACGCCGLQAFCDSRGQLSVLYRTARDEVHRDMHLLSGVEDSRSIQSEVLGNWSAAICVMSTAAFCQTQENCFAAWETENSIQFSSLNDLGGSNSKRVKPWTSLGGRSPQKHPCIAINKEGIILVAWTEGTSWNNGGDIAWQLFDQSGKPIRRANGRQKGLPVWSYPAAFSREDGAFTILF